MSRVAPELESLAKSDEGDELRDAQGNRLPSGAAYERRWKHAIWNCFDHPTVACTVCCCICCPLGQLYEKMMGPAKTCMPIIFVFGESLRVVELPFMLRNDTVKN